MTTLDKIKDVLWLYSTHEQHPFQVDEAYVSLKDGGNLVIDSLIGALEQTDIDLKMSVLQLLRSLYTDAKRALPAVRAMISDDGDRLIRCTAINTVGIMGDTSEGLIPLLTPRHASVDDFEPLFSAGIL